MWDSKAKKRLQVQHLVFETKIAPTIKGSDTFPLCTCNLFLALESHIVPYKEERGKVSFQCGTLKPKKITSATLGL